MEPISREISYKESPKRGATRDAPKGFRAGGWKGGLLTLHGSGTKLEHSLYQPLIQSVSGNAPPASSRSLGCQGHASRSMRSDSARGRGQRAFDAGLEWVGLKRKVGHPCHHPPPPQTNPISLLSFISLHLTSRFPVCSHFHPIQVCSERLNAPPFQSLPLSFFPPSNGPVTAVPHPYSLTFPPHSLRPSLPRRSLLPHICVVRRL